MKSRKGIWNHYGRGSKSSPRERERGAYVHLKGNYRIKKRESQKK